MKKISILLLSVLLIFTACDKDETEPATNPSSTTSTTDDDNDDNSGTDDTTTEDGDIMWEYDTEYYQNMQSLLVLDANDNSYFVNKESNYIRNIYSIKKDGTLNWKVATDDVYARDLMVVNDKLYYLSGANNPYGTPNTVRCYSTIDGSLLWTSDVSTGFQMAYSNNTLYVLVNVDNSNSAIISIDPNSGAQNWSETLTGICDASLRTNGTHLCVTANEIKYENSDNTGGVTMYSDNGSGLTQNWRWETIDYHTNRATPFSILDGNGNVFYADFTGSTTKVKCFNETTGELKWETQVASVSSWKANIYYNNNRVFVTYYDQPWSDLVMTNSISVLNSTDGSIISSNSGVLSQHLPTDVYITGNNNFLELNNSYTLNLHSESGSNILSYPFEYMSCNDLKITSEGNIIIQSEDNGKIYCVKASLVAPSASSWAYFDGNAGNTCGIN